MGPNVYVGVSMGRTAMVMVALLAVLKAGGAYMPLEASYPAERLAFMLRDAGAALVITERGVEGQLPSCERLVLDSPSPSWRSCSAAPLAIRVTPADRAYVIFTSGSTGTPKGVEVPHRAIVRLVSSPNYVDLGPDQVLLHAAPLAFDASTFEIWGALLHGGKCVVYSERVPSAEGLRACVDRHGVTTAWLTAALFNAVVDEDPGCLRKLRQVLTGGEALSVAHVRRASEALPDTVLINGYGPTETTTFAVCHRIPRLVDYSASSAPPRLSRCAPATATISR